MKFIRPLLLVLACVGAVAFAGCASTPEDTTKTGRQEYNTVPWNKPESWEGKGALGGIVQ